MSDKQISFTSSSCQDEIKLTELTTLKASFEYLKKRHRGCQKILEKEFQTVTKAIEEFKSSDSDKDARNSLREFLDNVSRLKRKAETIVGEELAYTKTCKLRLEHLINLSDGRRRSLDEDAEQCASHLTTMVTTDGKTGLHRSKTLDGSHDGSFKMSSGEMMRLQRHLCDHLFARNYCRTALELGRNIHPKSDENSTSYDRSSCLGLVEIYKEALEIQQGLVNGDTRPLDSWLMAIQYKYKNINNGQLHCKNQMKMNLQLFKVYLLIKQGKYEDAIKLAQSFCTSKSITKGSDALEKLSKVMTLMVLRDQDQLVETARGWQVDEQWIVCQLHEFVLQFYSFYRSPSVLSLMVNTGIAVRKTDACYLPASKQRHCVVCRDPINRISKPIPPAHYDHSVLICWHTGLYMDEHNPPLAFPNGYVYCSKAIPELRHGNDEVICPRSGYKCKEKELQKVFIV